MSKHILIVLVLSLFSYSNYCDASSPQNKLPEKKILKEYRSLYRNVTVYEYNGQRCLRLKNKVNNKNRQSCLYLRDHSNLAFYYSRAMLMALSTLEKPENILILGLGGGTVPRTIADYLPEVNITSVELDPAVVKAAEDYFFFKPSKRQKVVVQDARYFVKKQAKKPLKYDLIILDVFDGDYIPEHLTTKEFLLEVKSLLKPRAMLLANTFSHRKFYSSESVTYQSVFPDFCMLKDAPRVIVAYNGKACRYEELLPKMADKASGLLKYISRPIGMLNTLTDKKDWDSSAPIMTDQYSPANLLNKTVPK